MSMWVGIGTSKSHDPSAAAKEAAIEAKSKIQDKKYNIAFVFGSIELSSPPLLNTLAAILGNIPIVGCSGIATISSRGIEKHGLVVALIGSDEIALHVASVSEIHSKGALASGEELTEKLLMAFAPVRRDLGLLFCDGLIEEGSQLLKGMQERLGLSFPIIGGSASDNLSFSKTYLYFRNVLLNDAAIGVIFGGKINFGLGIRHGWKPLGKPRVVTSSKGNIIRAIDNEPAVKLYEDYLDKKRDALISDLRKISILYPIGVYLKGEDEYLLRNIISIQQDGSLVCQGDIPQESLVRLMIGTKESCMQAARQAAEEAKKEILGLRGGFAKKDLSQKINLVFVFESVSRYILLGRKAINELEILKGIFGEDTPIIGVYTYGEQAPLRAISYHGQAHFHNQTISILAIGG